MVNQNYFENEDLVSTVDFRVQSTVSWERSIGKLCFAGDNLYFYYVDNDHEVFLKLSENETTAESLKMKISF